MAAYNWVRFSATCPVCKQAADIRAQTHMVSSFDGPGNIRCRDRTYAIGDQMRWWPDDQNRSWVSIHAVPKAGSAGVYEECCYSNCQNCDAALFAVIQFKDRSPIAVSALGRESEWPVRYPG